MLETPKRGFNYQGFLENLSKPTPGHCDKNGNLLPENFAMEIDNRITDITLQRNLFRIDDVQVLECLKKVKGYLPFGALEIFKNKIKNSFENGDEMVRQIFPSTSEQN